MIFSVFRKATKGTDGMPRMPAAVFNGHLPVGIPSFFSDDAGVGSILAEIQRNGEYVGVRLILTGVLVWIENIWNFRQDLLHVI